MGVMADDKRGVGLQGYYFLFFLHIYNSGQYDGCFCKIASPDVERLITPLMES